MLRYQHTIIPAGWEGGAFRGECPKGELKEVKNRKGQRRAWMAGTVTVLVLPKTIISMNKDSEDRLKILQLSRKTPAPPGQGRDIMAQISIDAFHREGVIFVVNVKDMFSRKDHIQIPAVPVCAVYFRLGSRVYHPLDRPGCLIPAYNMPHNLPGFSAYHRHNVNIFPGFRPGLVLQKPVQLIQFNKFCSSRGFLATLPSGALFLSNSLHWTCSSPEFFPRRGR